MEGRRIGAPTKNTQEKTTDRVGCGQPTAEQGTNFFAFNVETGLTELAGRGGLPFFLENVFQLLSTHGAESPQDPFTGAGAEELKRITRRDFQVLSVEQNFQKL